MRSCPKSNRIKGNRNTLIINNYSDSSVKELLEIVRVLIDKIVTSPPVQVHNHISNVSKAINRNNNKATGGNAKNKINTRSSNL